MGRKTKMRPATVVFLYFFVVTARGKLNGFPETALDLENVLLQDSKSVARPANFRTAVSTFGNLVSRSAKYKAALQDEDEHFGDDEGSGVSPSEKPSPIMKLVSAIPLDILPPLAELKKAREKQNRDFGKEFVEALKNEPENEQGDLKVKALFGEHIRKSHESCSEKKLEFVKAAHKSGLFDKLPVEAKDFSDEVEKIIKKHEKGGDVFKSFLEAVELHGVQKHLTIQLLIQVGGILTDAACDEDLEGYFEAIRKFIHEHEGDKFVDKEACKRPRYILRCCMGIRKYIRNAPKGLKQRSLRLMFDDKCSRSEAVFVRNALIFIREKIRLDRKFASLMGSFQEPMKKIMELYKADKKKEADLALANFVLSSNRKGKLIRFLLPYYVTSKPTSGPGIESKREEKDDDPLAYFIEQQQGTDEL